jgi:hypothetical protein
MSASTIANIRKYCEKGLMHDTDDGRAAGLNQRLERSKKIRPPEPPKNEGDDSPNPLPDDVTEAAREGGDQSST